MQNTCSTPLSTTNGTAEFAQAMPSIKVDTLKAKVTVTTDTKSAKKTAVADVPVLNNSPKLSVERAAKDDVNLIKHDRAHYVAEFKRGVEKTARATLETCRVVYEASRVLDTYQFQNFCKDVGYRDGSSTIRKFIAIGKVYPRFIEYADQMPSGWTAIYQITQIPADDFEAYLKHGKRLDELKGKRLSELTKKTLDTSDITKPLAYDDQASGHVLAKVVSTKKLDEKDWRAIEKAMNEMAARLPIKFVVSKALQVLIEESRLRSYERSKKHYLGGQQFRPDTWDMGEEANAVLPRTEPEIVQG